MFHAQLKGVWCMPITDCVQRDQYLTSFDSLCFFKFSADLFFGAGRDPSNQMPPDAIIGQDCPLRQVQSVRLLRRNPWRKSGLPERPGKILIA